MKPATNGRMERRALFLAGAHCQGGHSEAGAAIAEILDAPFPLTMEGLEKAAIRDGFDPKALWPWLYRLRSQRAAVATEASA